MSKSTETTNDRVPRVLVRFGKHPSSVWKPHQACGNPIKRVETPSSVWKHPSSVGKHPSSVWKPHRAWGNTHQLWGNTHRAWGNTHRAWGNTRESWGNTRESCGNVGRTEALPKAKWRGCTEALLGSTEACGTLGTRGRGAWGG